jgi:hypothetical protein
LQSKKIEVKLLKNNNYDLTYILIFKILQKKLRGHPLIIGILKSLMIFMSNNTLEIVQLIAQYIPKEQRILLLKDLLEVYGSIYKTSKITKISRPQLYSYLASDKRSYPNDQVTARILVSLMEIKRTLIKDRLRQLSKDFNELITKI